MKAYCQMNALFSLLKLKIWIAFERLFLEKFAQVNIFATRCFLKK